MLKYKGIKLFFLVILIIRLSFPGQNVFSQIQSIEFKHLSVQDGLSRSWVKCIYQDKYGFLWFGTSDGLNKYDGYTFKIYRHSSSQKNSLNHNNINTIYEDSKGKLWVGTQVGLNSYNRDTDEFIPTTAIQTYVDCVYEYEKGVQLVGTPVGLFVMNPEDLSAKQVYSDSYVMDIFIDNKNNCWLATLNGLLLFDTSDYSFHTIKLPGDEENSGENNIQKIFQDSDGRIWLGTSKQGLFIMEYPEGNPLSPAFYQYKPDPFNKKSVSQGAVYALLEDNDKQLWIGTENGGLNIIDLKNFDRTRCNFHYFMHNPNDNSSLSNNSIHTIYRDNQNTIWLGVYDGGLNYYNSLSQKFIHVKQNPNTPNSLNNNHVNVLYEEENKLWIGTEEGLNIWDIKTDTYLHYTHDFNDDHSIGSNAVWAIFRDSRGSMWIGTWGGGLNLFNEKTGKFTRYQFNENDSASIGGNNIYGITEDKNGLIWIASMLGGLNSFDYKTRKFTRYKYKAGRNSLPTDWLCEVHESINDELWIATTEALTLFDRKTGKFRVFKNNPQNTGSISYNGITDIFEDSKQNIWLGTNNGLNLYHRDDSSFSCYQVKNGLPNNSIKAICEDDEGNLWLTTNNGLSKFIDAINIPDSLRFINYDITDGLQGNEFTDRSIFKGKDGIIYIGGSNGFNAFYPDKIKENPFAPEIVFTDFLISNKSITTGAKDSPLQRHINMANKVNLTRKHAVFSIEYAALNFISPEKNEYAYKLEGFDKDWNYIGSKRIATYTNLDPGKYIFRVRATNNDGIWNETGKELTINILPAWWQTTLAKAIYILLGLIALYFFRKYTIISTTDKNKLWLEHIENQKSEELNNLKFQFFTNISHELRTPLTLISGPVNRLLQADYARKELHLIKNNVTRLIALVDQILDFRRIESDKVELNLKKTDVIEIVHNTFFNFNDLAEQRRINLVFNSPVHKLIIDVDEDKIQKIISNITSNAIKYTPEGGTIKLKIAIENTQPGNNDLLKIIINDTGYGISKGNIDKIFDLFFTSNELSNRTVGTGIGLHLTKKLIELHGGSISVKSKPGKGSKFKILIPIEKYQSSALQKELIVENKFAETEAKTQFIPQAIAHEYSILIIDDNNDICSYLETLLKDNYNVTTETNPLKGMDKILEILPDIIISDVMMPEMDGFELCKKIKTDIRFSHIPVILLTAKATTENRIAGFDIGADEYIYKPFDEDLLRSRIRNLLKQREQLKTHFIGSDGIVDGSLGVNELDKDFIEKIISIIEQNYQNQEFNMNVIIDDIGMSRSVFYRKFKSLSNQPINDLIKNYRLKKAKELLKGNSHTISEIAYDCGFADPGYFSKVFKEQYNISPKSFQKSLEK
ncbi:MAG: response regulator [Bacteroidales bacterium]|nr:response regulator [Bacteroidales bacterium]MBN2817546.1 response regulator [Bacteroidales bacterium]